MKSDEIRQRLLSMADPVYAAFSSTLLPGTLNIIGVRLPQLRRLSRELAKQNITTFLAPQMGDYFEEIMLRGMIIGELRCSAAERLELIKTFIPTITNWSVCDSFCVSLKFTNANKELVFQFIKPYLSSQKEYEARFGFVMLTFYYIDDGYYKEIFKAVTNMKNDDYYADMAAAWCLSMVGVPYPDQTLDFLIQGNLSDRVLTLTKKKICESRQYNLSYKKQIKEIKTK